MFCRHITGLICGLILLLASPVFAVVLDWSSVTWTPGSLTQSYDVDSDGFNDLRVTFSGNTGALAGGSPAISTSYQGVETLAADLDFSSMSGSITVTITFLNTLATDLSFSLYDIDADRKGNSSNFAYQDLLSGITGLGEKGTVTPTVTVGSSVTYASGTAQGDDVVPSSSSAGNVNVTFSEEVASIQFTYGSSGNIAGNDPDPQDFAITKVSFRKVPEVGVAPIAAGLCVACALLRFPLRRLFAK